MILRKTLGRRTYGLAIGKRQGTRTFSDRPLFRTYNGVGDYCDPELGWLTSLWWRWGRVWIYRIDRSR